MLIQNNVILCSDLNFVLLQTATIVDNTQSTLTINDAVLSLGTAINGRNFRSSWDTKPLKHYLSNCRETHTSTVIGQTTYHLVYIENVSEDFTNSCKNLEDIANEGKRDDAVTLRATWMLHSLLRAFQPFTRASTGITDVLSGSSAMAAVSEGVLSWLHVEMLKAEAHAQEQAPSLRSQLEKHSKAVAFKRPAQLVTDLMPLDSSSAEFKKVVQDHAVHPVSAVLKVNVPARTQRFQNYISTLPQDKRSVVISLHGTPIPANATSIARQGPDITRAGSNAGTALGQGFYTAEDKQTPAGYSGATGAVCVCEVAPGNMKEGGNTSITAATLASSNPPFDSIHANNTWHVLFHPDSVDVKYIIEHGSNLNAASQAAARDREAYEAAFKKHQVQETQRINKVEELKNHLRMVDVFVSLSNSLANGLNAQNVLRRRKLFELEQIQFEKKLPMYGYKNEFVQKLNHSQTLVVKGGTGIGKSVCVPQWCYDHVLSDVNSTSPLGVAVLVPRRAIAENLSKYLCRMRKSTLGGEIGIGTSDSYKTSDITRITFFTYGFFKAITLSDKRMSKWGVVICDEAHERCTDMDELSPRLKEVLRNRRDFKLVIMSATVDVDAFASHYSVEDGIVSNEQKGDSNLTGTNTPVLEVPGVNFPVEVIWWDGEPWDSAAENAMNELCVEVLRIFNHEESGNVLVFVSTTRDVNQCVDILNGMTQHDTDIVVLPLFAALGTADRDKVENFASKSQNRGKRLICISTNVAEAGITIPGVTAIVDTGKELSMCYDLVTKTNIGTVSWISQASHLQRRGRAGRTEPGKCYCMFSENDFNESMNEQSIPPILKMNCDSFYLGLVASGINPDTVVLMDEVPAERIEAAKSNLLRLHAIEVDDKGGSKLTDTGKLMNRLPLDLSLAKCIMEGANLKCTEQICKIVCLAQVISSRGSASSLFEGSKEQTLEAKRQFRQSSGDHETYLRLFEEWEDRHFDHGWCTRHNIRFQTLSQARVLLKKVHKVLGENRIPLLSDPLCSSETIVRCMARGLIDNLAVAMNPTKSGDQYQLVSGSDVNPTVVRIHTSSTITKEESAPMIMFDSRSLGGGTMAVSGVTKISKELSLEIQSQNFDDYSDFQKFREQIESLQYVNFERIFRWTKDHERVYFNANVKDLKKEFPLIVIKILPGPEAKSCVASISCPVSQRRMIEGKIDFAFSCGKDASETISDIDDIDKYVDNKKGLTLAGQSLRDDCREYYGEKHIQFTGDRATKSLTVTANSTLVDDVVERITAELKGLPMKLGGGAQVPIPIPTKPSASANASTPLSLLLNANTSPATIQQRVGNSLAGSMLTMAHIILWHTDCWLYGGFIRDFIIRGDSHNEMDLDIGM